MKTLYRTLPALALALLAPFAAEAAPRGASGHPAAESRALDLAMKSIAIRSVRGEGNRAGEVAALYRSALLAGGWQAADITVTPFDDTAYLIATWQGSDPKLKPLVLSGHMDVVEAKPADWQRDPFTPVVENGVLYGRGATDMKVAGALALSSLIELRQSGYKPRRTIIIEFSGDEETRMATSAVIAKKLSDAEMIINIDSGGGTFHPGTDTPQFWNWAGAEKAYADFQIEATNPGGHSSAPTPDNAIVQVSQALVRIGAYHFPAEQNPITHEWFAKAAAFEPDPTVAAAMRTFADHPDDAGALAILRARPELVGKVGTTCVPTMIWGGHAINALPQRATANVNCRIFPGHGNAEIMAELKRVAGDVPLKFTDVTDGSIPSPASPVRADFVNAATKAIRAAWGKDVPVIPVQESGATDSMFSRAIGVPAYGASPIFTRDDENFSHGLNERVRLVNFGPAVTFFLSLIPDLSR